MDYQHQQTGKCILRTKQDLQSAKNKIDAINKECCTERTLKMLDEAYECIDMAIRFIDQIDMGQYDAGFVSENIL